jgi:hypothetical protein
MRAVEGDLRDNALVPIPMIVAEVKSVALKHICRVALGPTLGDEESDSFEETAIDGREQACFLYSYVSEHSHTRSLETYNLQSCRERDLLVYPRLV